MSGKDNSASTSGFVTSGNPFESMDSVVTWHDLGTIRIWIGSKVIPGRKESREIVSIEFQFLGDAKKNPSQIEKKSRLQLLNEVYVGGRSKPDLDASQIRQFPVGKILEEHSQIVGREVLALASPVAPKLYVASEVKSSSQKRTQGRQERSAVEANYRNSNADSIFIAYVYANQFAAGSTKLAKRTAEILNIDANTVHVALKIARRSGWITSLGAGKSGGHLTELGLQAFEQFDGPKRLENLSKGIR